MVDLILRFIDLFNQPAKIHLYAYQRVFIRRIIESLLVHDGQVITGLWSRQCLAADTVILDRDGSSCRIKDHPRAWYTGHRPVYRVRAKNGFELRATDNHPFLTKRGWVRVDELREDDVLCVLDEWDKFDSPPIEHTTSVYVNRHRTDEVTDTFEITEDHGRLLGYLTADGYSFRALEMGQSIKFTNITEQYLAEVESLVERLFPDVETKRYPKGRGFDILCVSRQGRSAKTSSLRRFLAAMAPDDKFPTAMFTASRGAVIAFFQSLYSSDGCASRGIEPACGGSRQYAHYCQLLLAKLGVDGRVKEECLGGVPFFRITTDDKLNMQRFLSIVGPIPGKEAACAALDLDYVRWSSRSYERAPDGEDGEKRLWVGIISIEPDGEDDVWDIEYPGKGWFFAQGIAVHNSGKSEALSSLAVASCVIVPTLAKAFPLDDRLSQYVNGLWIGIFAPKQQQSGIIYERIRHRASRASSEEIYRDPDIQISVSQSRGDQVSWTNGSFVSAQTASEQSNVEGKTFHIVFIDEAQLVGRSKVQKEISPMLAACVTGSTLIPMQNGELLTMSEVQELKRGDVWAISETAGLVPAQVSEFIDSGVQPTMRATLKSGRYAEGTRHHPVLVRAREGKRNLEWRRLDQLRIGDHVCLARQVPVFGTLEAGGADEAYLLGMMVGDGSYRQDGLPRLSNADLTVWQAAERVAERRGLRTNYTAGHETIDGRDYLEATFSSDGHRANWLISSLRRFGLWGQTSAEKRFGDLGLLKKAELAEALAGLYDADGHVSLQQERAAVVGLTSISRPLLDEVLTSLQRFGIHGTIRERFYPARKIRGHWLAASSAWCLNVSGKENVEAFAREIPVRIPHKSGNLRQAVETYKAHASKRAGAYPDLLWEKVIKLEDTGLQQVWDVVVPEHHSFIGNGIVMHNTNGSMVKIGTASISRGGFHDSITHNLEQQKKHGVRNHFEFPYDLVIREKKKVYEQTKEVFHLNYEKWVTTEIERVGGVDNDEFKMNFRLMWQEMSTGAVDRECFFLSRNDEAEANVPKGTGRLVAGIDLGKTIDDTVITVVEEGDTAIVDMRAILPGGDKEERVVFYVKHIVAWAEAHGKWESQLDQILGFLSNYAIDTVVVDSTGVGDPISERLALLMPGVQVIPVPLSMAGNDRIYKFYLQELEAGRLQYPAGPRTVRMKEFQKFVHQHEILGKTYKGPNSQYISCSAPDGEHDDYCDSAALAVWATNTPRQAEVVASFDTGYSRGAKGFATRSERYRLPTRRRTKHEHPLFR